MFLLTDEHITAAIPIPVLDEPPIKIQPDTWRVNRIFGQIQENVNNNLAKCDEGTELDTFLRTLMPSPWALDYQCLEVKQDLYTVLEPLNPKRLDLFGSNVMGLAFEGTKFSPTQN